MSEESRTTSFQPPRETQIVTVNLNGTWTAIPAYQTANLTLFPNYNGTALPTRAPVTTVFGAEPPPPYISSITSSQGNGENGASSKAIVLRNWGLVIMSLVIVAVIGGLILRRYRSGREKKQEPGVFMSVGEEDDGGRMGGGSSGGSGLPGGSSISLGTTNLGGQGQGMNSTVRERRYSAGLQPMPRALERQAHPS